jgi:hypothetical protein
VPFGPSPRLFSTYVLLLLLLLLLLLCFFRGYSAPL